MHKLDKSTYFLTTTGNVTIDTMKAYIENQRVEQE